MTFQPCSHVCCCCGRRRRGSRTRMIICRLRSTYLCMYVCIYLWQSRGIGLDEAIRLGMIIDFCPVGLTLCPSSLGLRVGLRLVFQVQVGQHANEQGILQADDCQCIGDGGQLFAAQDRVQARLSPSSTLTMNDLLGGVGQELCGQVVLHLFVDLDEVGQGGGRGHEACLALALIHNVCLSLKVTRLPLSKSMVLTFPITT